ncbi:hypothetical protein QTP88_001437 [Uroleucon formosanum]
MLELTALNISVVEFCRWPPFHVTSVELANADDPEDLWGLFKIKILSNKIYGRKELVASNFILNRLLTKVEVLETNSKNNNLNSAMANQYIDSNFLSLFPINNKDAFLSVELKIVNEVYFVLKLESFIKSIGGRGSKNNITRVLQKLFSDKFAVISTWSGRGKYISIKIGSSEVIKLIKRILKANSNDSLTDSEYENTVANWLRHANTRLRRAE